MLERLLGLHATYTTNLDETLRIIWWDSSDHWVGQFIA